MKFRDFENKIQALPVFNLNDARKLDPNFSRVQLNYWQNQRYIIPLAGGYYALANRNINEFTLFFLANKLCEPSYISLESALSYYEIIPEAVFQVTSITSHKTQRFFSNWGTFNFRSIKPLFMFGYLVKESGQKIKYKIATLEKSILDYLYLHHEVRTALDVESLRWNVNQLNRMLDINKLEKYAEIYSKKALDHRVKVLKEFINA